MHDYPVRAAVKREGYWFCDQCPEYPCEACREGEERYQSQYALQESPKGNLEFIREEGMERFLQRQRERWSCPDCGSLSLCTMGFAGIAGGSLAPAEKGKVNGEFPPPGGKMRKHSARIVRSNTGLGPV